MAALGGDTGRSTGLDIKDGSVDHSRVKPCNGLSDVEFQLVQVCRPWVVHHGLEVAPQEEIKGIEVR